MSSIKLKHSGGNSVSLNPPTSAPTSTEVAFKLPNADGTTGHFIKTDGSGNLSFAAGGGITMADQWRRTAGVGTNDGENFLTSDWSRVGSNNYMGTVPTDTNKLMSQSGGIFTFPSTGIYYVSWQAYCEISSSSRSNAVNIYITTNNSSYSNKASMINSVNYDTSGYSYAGGMCCALIDVTDVTQVKVKFRVYSKGSGTWDAASGENRNCATFIRLGDT